jgi:putative tryptophan/tyrosine transport system substrate-binding protein
MRRREFVALLGVAATAWPFATLAQQAERLRRIGVLSSIGGNIPEVQARHAAFLKELQGLGWSEGGNMRIDVRYTSGDRDLARKYAAELVALGPDVIVTFGTVTTEEAHQTIRTIPIVFGIVTDPVGAGFVESLSRPGGNATGFMMFEYGLSAKWPELLKQIAPEVNQVGVLRDREPDGVGQFAVIESVAPSIGVEAIPINLGDAAEIERGVANIARFGRSGLIVTAGAPSVVNRDLIIKLAAQYKLPTIYYERTYIAAGGLVSYGPNFIDQYRAAASYVDRILKGAKPADLPVQAPTKYELVINQKTAAALGLTIPATVLTRVDEAIE